MLAVSLAEALTVSEGPCIEKQRLADATAGWLKVTEIDDRLRVDVQLHDNATATVVVRNDGEITVQRDLDLPDHCADQHSALGFVIAISIDASVFEEFAPEVAQPEPGPEPEPEPPVATDKPELKKRDRVEAPPRPKTRVDLFAGGFAGFELLPGVAFGGRAGVTVGPVPWLDIDIEALAAGGLPFSIGDGEVQPTLAGGAVSGCPARRWTRFALRGCIGIAGAAVIAQGRDFDESRTSTLPWVAGRAMVDARFALHRLVWLGIGAGFVAPIVRTNFDLVNEGGIVTERRQVAAAAGLVGFDLAVTIPGTL